MRYSVAAILVALSFSTYAQEREPIVGLPCEGCEAVFEGRPTNLSDRSRIGRIGEPGEPMTLVGRVTNASGKPAAGVIIYAYQTNADGIYPTDDSVRGMASHRHGKLRAWAKTNSNGNYAFDTIRPAGYPGTDLPQHIHMHVIEPGCSTYYIDDAMFRDDPRLTTVQIKRLTLDRGSSGLSRPNRVKGVWFTRRDIVLGKNIPGYRNCTRPAI